MEVKKVAIIEHVGGQGGMDYYDYGLALGLASNRIEVNFHTCKETNIRQYKRVNTIFAFGYLQGKTNIVKLWKLFFGYYKSFNTSRKNKVQIVHLHFFHFRILQLIIIIGAKIFPFKTVITVHDVFSFFNLSNKLYEKLILKLADGIIVHNQTSFNDIIKKHPRLSNIVVIPHGNYLPFIKSPSPKINKSETLRILFFGQIKEVKGLDVLLTALKIALDEQIKFELTIAGKPNRSDFDKYVNLIDELKLNNNIKTILRYIEDDEIEDLFGNSDLVALPYKMISQSGVILLSMSYQLPVLVSNLPAFTEIVQDNQTGFIFESENPKSLASKLSEIYSNRELIQKVSLNSIKLITDKYDWSKIGEKTISFYNSILEE